MKVLFLLFLTFIKYSYSNDLQNVPIGISLRTLRISDNDDYFYFSTSCYTSYSFAYLLLIDDRYTNYIYYCYASTSPSQSTIGACSFKYIKYYDLYNPSLQKEYYYKIPISSSKPYIIIRYSGRFSNRIKARISVNPLIPKVVDLGYSIKLSSFENTDNYFSYSIGNSSSSYLYFYIDDTFHALKEPIYYCKTLNNPDYYFPSNSCFFPIYYYDKNVDDLYDYSYRVDTSAYSGGYIIIRYSVRNSGCIYVKSTYTSSYRPFPVVSIVLNVIASVAFVIIIISFIRYFCKKRDVNNIINEPTQPAMADSNLPKYPLME